MANPRHLRMGGLFQMWLWPAGLAKAAMLLLGAAKTGLRLESRTLYDPNL